MNKLGSHLVVLTLALAGTIALQGPVVAQTDVTPAGRGPSMLSPGRAAALSIVPGLGQHYMGEHRRGYLMEAGFACGAILYATGGSNDGSGSYTVPEYTPPSYTPPSHGAIRMLGSRGARLFRVSSSGSGSGYGDGGGTSTGRKLGIGFMAASAVWSVIDAPITARRAAAERSVGADTNRPADAGLRLALEPSWEGFSAGVSLRF